ncbi:uncharacterized protein PSANT_00917 [Moesziomyces antarcticus]|uniref:Uncharacterized protein n=1 Tax=Pseudozyma antarctica TaxID=84753 RepID=A0A5C3FFP6_PSEA2|nr:uncharacterized protein PSANT_00917 [Moesziomyces antarcticus]
MAANVDTLHEFSAPRQGAIRRHPGSPVSVWTLATARAEESASVSLKRARNQPRTRCLRTAGGNLDERALRQSQALPCLRSLRGGHVPCPSPSSPSWPPLDSIAARAWPHLPPYRGWLGCRRLGKWHSTVGAESDARVATQTGRPSQ